MDFSEIKNMYNEARTEERNKISRFFHTQDDFKLRSQLLELA